MFSSSHVRISLDLLRTRHRERAADVAPAHAQPFVVDNTLATVATRARYITPSQAAGFRVARYYFESNVPASIQRNNARDGPARVLAAAIGGTKRRLALHTRAEGFDTLSFVRLGPDGGFLGELPLRYHDA